jgi:hypothetical protein
MTPDGANQRRGEYYVTDQPQPDQENSQALRWPAAADYGSTVASSMSITGMSSLMG